MGIHPNYIAQPRLERGWKWTGKETQLARIKSVKLGTKNLMKIQKTPPKAGFLQGELSMFVYSLQLK